MKFYRKFIYFELFVHLSGFRDRLLARVKYVISLLIKINLYTVFLYFHKIGRLLPYPTIIDEMQDKSITEGNYSSKKDH